MKLDLFGLIAKKIFFAACAVCIFAPFAPLASDARATGAPAQAKIGVSTAHAGYPFLDNSLKNRAEAGWLRYKETIGAPLSAWVKSALPPKLTGTVFYPFSGPDFVTLTQIFPDADRYVMVAMQAAGKPADPEKMSTVRALNFQNKFLNEWLKFGRLGFFRTHDLNDDQVDDVSRIGVSTIIKTFAVYSGYDVLDVFPIAFDAGTGTFERVTTDHWRSVRLLLSKEGKPVTIDYVSLDLSDGYLSQHLPIQGWLAREAANPVLLKAASHLLQETYFSVLRDILIKQATLVVQDETGLNYEDLVRIGQVDLYGRFLFPHELFNKNKQRALAKAYVDSAASVKELPFAFSYNKSKDRNCLQVARRGS
jgi:hypothetical protein